MEGNGVGPGGPAPFSSLHILVLMEAGIVFLFKGIAIKRLKA